MDIIEIALGWAPPLAYLVIPLDAEYALPRGCLPVGFGHDDCRSPARALELFDAQFTTSWTRTSRYKISAWSG